MSGDLALILPDGDIRNRIPAIPCWSADRGHIICGWVAIAHIESIWRREEKGLPNATLIKTVSGEIWTVGHR